MQVLDQSKGLAFGCDSEMIAVGRYWSLLKIVLVGFNG